jgi:hypothetical protein
MLSLPDCWIWKIFLERRTYKGRTVPNHVSETTVLTMTLGESRATKGKELIAALVAGDDLAAGLHLAADHPLAANEIEDAICGLRPG